jgi:hypothetical protein
MAGNGITFYGSEGKLYVNRGQFKFWLGAEQKADTPGKFEAIASQFLGANAKRVYRSDDHKADWIQCIRSRKGPVADVEIGARTVTVCHLVNLAYLHRQSLKWDPKHEKFLKGAGDPKWLDRTYRSPWKLT